MASAVNVSYLSSTIGRKQLVAISGLVWALFVFGHMAGNMLLLFSPELYNRYGHAIVSNKILLYGTEAALIGTILAHVAMALVLTWRNRRARPQRYAVAVRGAKSVSAASRTMIFQGSIILVFVITHLATFKYGSYYEVTYDGVVMRDLHRLVVEVFQEPGYVAWYVVALLCLMAHLSHGVSSVFQTWGLNHPQYEGGIKLAGYIYAAVVGLGFLSQPIYVFLQGF